MSERAHVVEFDCQDCEVHVFAVGLELAPTPPRCGVCAWIAEFVPDPDEARLVRERAGLVP